MAYHNIRQKVEDAVYALLQQAPIDGANYYRTADVVARDADITYPFISVAGTNCTPEFDVGPEDAASGNRVVSVTVTVANRPEDVRTGGDGAVEMTMRDYHGALVAETFDQLWQSDIKDKLNAQAVGGLYVNQVELGDETFAPAEWGYRTELALRVHAIPRD